MSSWTENRTLREVEDFFTSLVDFSFKELITPRILKVIFGLGIIAAFIFAAAHADRIASGFLLTLFVFLALFVFYVVIIRVFLELIMVFFRIAENTESLRTPEVVVTSNDEAEEG